MLNILTLEEEKRIREQLVTELGDRLHQLDERGARAFAADCASRVLHMYADRFPNDRRLASAVSAARLVANGSLALDGATGEFAAARQAADCAKAHVNTANENLARTQSGEELGHAHRMAAAYHAAESACACGIASGIDAATTAAEHAAVARSHTVSPPFPVGDADGFTIEHVRATEEYAWQLKRIKGEA